mmetsp:Transcript_33007/g.81743  ORF Transcript_33007/g.81743 Transcript_33007/m.81743 type:complete len:106 (-) Transcript_33007:421-738(-)
MGRFDRRQQWHASTALMQTESHSLPPEGRQSWPFCVSKARLRSSIQAEQTTHSNGASSFTDHHKGTDRRRNSMRVCDVTQHHVASVHQTCALSSYHSSVLLVGGL